MIIKRFLDELEMTPQGCHWQSVRFLISKKQSFQHTFFEKTVFYIIYTIVFYKSIEFCANWITNHKNIGDYLSLKIPNYIAEFLTKVDLTQENNGALTISFNYTSNSINIEEKIKKGLILVPYPLEMRQL